MSYRMSRIHEYSVHISRSFIAFVRNPRRVFRGNIRFMVLETIKTVLIKMSVISAALYSPNEWTDFNYILYLGIIWSYRRAFFYFVKCQNVP